MDWRSLALKTAVFLHFFGGSAQKAEAQDKSAHKPVTEIINNDKNEIVPQISKSVTTTQISLASLSRPFGEHFIRQKFEDVPELSDKDPTPSVCIVSVDQYLKDGSIALKRVNPQDVIEKRSYEPMLWVEGRHGRIGFDFEEAYHNLSDGAKAYYDEAGPIAKHEFREQCERVYNDQANYKSYLCENMLNPRRVYSKGNKAPRIVRVGINQANPTVWAMEMAAFACHPDTLLQKFAANFVDMNDSTNKALLAQAGPMLYNADGSLQFGSDSVLKNRHEATKKLLKVKVGNICENQAGQVLKPTAPYQITKSGYRFFTQDCAQKIVEFDNEHHQTFCNAVSQFVRGVYMAQAKESAFYRVLKPEDRLKIETVGAHLESCNHYGPGAANTAAKIKEAAKDCQSIVKKMAHINYLTPKGIEDLREIYPQDEFVQRFCELSLTAVEKKNADVLAYSAGVLNQKAKEKQTQLRDAIEAVRPAVLPQNKKMSPIQLKMYFDKKNNTK